ncbi:hypothetical protein EDD25_0605 [Cryobacterium psychrophilum]|nr:hypothetical protein EDD25_0605 [Cryobacterium psychrophilum]
MRVGQVFSSSIQHALSKVTSGDRIRQTRACAAILPEASRTKSRFSAAPLRPRFLICDPSVRPELRARRARIPLLGRDSCPRCSLAGPGKPRPDPAHEPDSRPSRRLRSEFSFAPDHVIRAAGAVEIGKNRQVKGNRTSPDLGGRRHRPWARGGVRLPGFGPKEFSILVGDTARSAVFVPETTWSGLLGGPRWTRRIRVPLRLRPDGRENPGACRVRPCRLRGSRVWPITGTYVQKFEPASPYRRFQAARVIRPATTA